MKNPNTLKVTKFINYKSNAEIFAVDKNGNPHYFHVDYDYLSERARRAGGDTLKRAAIKRLKEQYPNTKFIVPSSIY
jgi:hypothetical protein